MSFYINNSKRVFTVFKDKKIVNFKPAEKIELTDEEAKSIIKFNDILKIDVETKKETKKEKIKEETKKEEIK